MLHLALCSRKKRPENCDHMSSKGQININTRAVEKKRALAEVDGDDDYAPNHCIAGPAWHLIPCEAAYHHSNYSESSSGIMLEITRRKVDFCCSDN